MATSTNDFYQECEVIKLESEYDGYTGEERYAIITDLSKSELHKRYSSQLKNLKPIKRNGTSDQRHGAERG